MYFKDTSNNLHFLDSSEFECLLPADCVAITDDEAQSIQAEIEANNHVVIPTLSMRQARLALLKDNLLSTVDSAITTDEQRIWWDYSTTVERSNPLVVQVLTALGKSASDIDKIFINASSL